MNIGLVSTWLHRGAAYVTINYAKLLQPEHNVFVFGRGGEYFDMNLSLPGVSIHKGSRIDSQDGVIGRELVKWIKNNKIDIIIWNEQRDLSSVVFAKKKCPDVLHGAYIDYYKESTVETFGIYDFLICNTKRHYSVFKWHPQCFYLPWGCDIDLYIPREKPEADQKYKVVFFHSMGMSNRKGTNVLINTFVKRELDKYNVKLVIHTQTNIDSIISIEEAKKHNIEIVEQTVPAPGLYYRGDVYVYPAKLDGLGLTLYEAISCGLPVITTDVAPMNEVVTEKNGRLVKVERYYCRSDGYYWPLADIDEESLYEALMYYINHADEIGSMSKEVRRNAVASWNLQDRKDQLLEIISSVSQLDNEDACLAYMSKYRELKRREKRSAFIKLFVPQKVFSCLKNKQVERKFQLDK